MFSVVGLCRPCSLHILTVSWSRFRLDPLCTAIQQWYLKVFFTRPLPNHLSKCHAFFVFWIDTLFVPLSCFNALSPTANSSKPYAMWGHNLYATLKFSDLSHWSEVYSPCGVWRQMFAVTQKATWGDFAAYCRQAWDKQALHSSLLIGPWKASVSERETTLGHLSLRQPLPARQLLISWPVYVC